MDSCFRHKSAGRIPFTLLTTFNNKGYICQHAPSSKFPCEADHSDRLPCVAADCQLQRSSHRTSRSQLLSSSCRYFTPLPAILSSALAMMGISVPPSCIPPNCKLRYAEKEQIFPRAYCFKTDSRINAYTLCSSPSWDQPSSASTTS